jgi:hypothetical protein
MPTSKLRIQAPTSSGPKLGPIGGQPDKDPWRLATLEGSAQIRDSKLGDDMRLGIPYKGVIQPDQNWRFDFPRPPPVPEPVLVYRMTTYGELRATMDIDVGLITCLLP